MAEQIQFITDMTRLQDLKYRKKPVIAEFYTEYLSIYLDGALLANRLEVL